MASRGSKRLEKELSEIRELSQDSTDTVTADSVDGNMMQWKGRVKGPVGTPYYGGSFDIDIQITEDYPYKPPKMKFATKIWHPNVSSQTGAICLDILGKEWGPARTIRTVLLSIQALLSAPEPDDPQDAEVAEMYKSNRKLFDQTAKKWTETHAGAQKSKTAKAKAAQAKKVPAKTVRATAPPKSAKPKTYPKATKAKSASKVMKAMKAKR